MTTSYNTDTRVVTGEVEYPATDPASGAFFNTDYKKNDDLKLMLDGSKDSLKLEAMKRIIGIIAKGRDASDLFPAVVKNVVSKNIEVKKLVYVYLVRYAEEQQDLALLSISTFQRALKDPNQYIRASALRVLSSIRVNMIVPIVLLAVREAAADMSPYVRKTAAHAIPKLYSLEPEFCAGELVTIIERLLSDRAPLVVGSAAMAFSEVCADRMDVIHKSYRKLCNLLADVDEWGQLALLNVLTVYAKSHFPDPNAEEAPSDTESEKSFYSGSGSHRARDPAVDPDHRLLLRAAKPLLQSRNAGVVVAVAQLYYHTAPAQELPAVAKALVRLLRAHVEVQSVVLNAVASLTAARRSLFEPFLKSFFVRTSDPTHIKLFKLEILTNLATEASAPVILREFQTYVTSSDASFVAATIQAIGRVALAIPAETDTCLSGLLQLLSSKDERVVCEAVVEVKRVVCGGAASARAAVSRAAKLLKSDRLAARARAAAVWLVAEHGAGQPCAPAVLAHLAASFADQEELVKLQVMTLAMKLCITRPETAAVGRYVCTLARYDDNYDVRDRARMLTRYMNDDELRARSHHVFLAAKPPPTMDNRYKAGQQLTLGSLSQYVGACAAGYAALPRSPAAALHRDLRDADPAPPPRDHTKKEFYSEPNSSGSGSSSSSSSSSESGSEESSDDEGSQSDKKEAKTKKVNNNHRRSSSSGTSDSESSSASSDSADSSDARSDAGAPDPPRTAKPAAAGASEKSNLELLLELDAASAGLPTMTPTCGGLLSPPAAAADLDIQPAPPSHTPTTQCELLSRVTAGGLGVTYRWTRRPDLYAPTMVAARLEFTNHSTRQLNDVRVAARSPGARALHASPAVGALPPGAAAAVTLGVDYGDSIQPLDLVVATNAGDHLVSIKPPPGELLRPVAMPLSRWDAELRHLRGMHECEKKVACSLDAADICRRVYEAANVGPVTDTGSVLRFAARLASSGELVLLSVAPAPAAAAAAEGAGAAAGGAGLAVRAHCGKMAFAALLANEVAQALLA